MTIQERKERERDEKRDLILNAASEIIAEEGIQNLSVRKIANRIEYSPSIIYHYFNDKDDIINFLMEKGYRKIVSTLSSACEPGDEPGPRLKKVFRSYIDMALQMPDEYKAIMLSSSPAILSHTSVLFKGASGQRQAVGILSGCLKDIFEKKDDDFIELTAQVIWTSIFGLIIRLIIETGIDEKQRNLLIEHHIRCIVDRMLLGKSLDI